MSLSHDEYGFDAFKTRASLADANSCFTPSWVIEVRRFFEDHGFAHFEEPCPYWELVWTKEVTDSLDIDATGASKLATS